MFPDDLTSVIRETKRKLRAQIPSLSQSFAALEDEMRRAVDDVVAQRERSARVIPELDYAEIRDGKVSNTVRDEIRKRGAVVVRNTFARAQAQAWDEGLAEYVTRNGYYEHADPKLDKYFATLKSGRPQIFGIYWSKPQAEARQHEALAATRAFLNRLWKTEEGGQQHFDPDREATYADRIRRREPGDRSFGLSPHMDAGSIERWILPAYQQVYRHVFSGDWQRFDPFDGAHRTEVDELPSTVMCSVFRTYQGWTALTRQGARGGTLQLVPIANSIAYLLLRPLLDDVPEDDLCGAEKGRALALKEEWHKLLMPAVTPIPEVLPGDTVWWHPDIVHAVGEVNASPEYANVMYIGAAPWCAKNAAYLDRQKRAFLKGESAPDFSPENYEVRYEGRARAEDLTPLGRKQMALEGW